MNNFSRILEAFRSEKHISKKDLARKAKLTPGYISLLTLGEREAPSQATVTALADALELDEKRRRELFEAAGHVFVPVSLHMLNEPALANMRHKLS